MSGPCRASFCPPFARSRSKAETCLLSRSLVVAVALIAMIGSSSTAGAQAPASELEGDYLYKTLMVRAAPGELLPLIDMLQERLAVYAEFSDAGPFWMRHTQGDQWDLQHQHEHPHSPDHGDAAAQRLYVQRKQAHGALKEKIGEQNEDQQTDKRRVGDQMSNVAAM